MTWQENFKHWDEFENLDPTLREELDALKEDPEALEDAFYQRIAFGTAGMRGLMGPGINRLNIYTVRLSTEGLARLMEDYGEEAKKAGVAIAYDGRHDSQRFAYESAAVLAKHGIPSYVYESLRPTPELSFTVRELETFAGIMITASHNTAEYNGYKVYGADGGQMTPEDADALVAHTEGVDLLTVPSLSQDELQASELLTVIGEELDQKYLARVAEVTIDQDLVKEMGDQVTIVYTPLHGTGMMPVSRALDYAGFESVVFVDEQKKPDPDFTYAPDPNPEDAAAFEYAIKYGEANTADILLATDPDADRMGGAVRLPNGNYQILTGNQIGALMTHYILQAKKEAEDLPSNGVILKSIVSSDLPAKIAAAYGVETVNTLTGFKWIADKIKQYEKDQSKIFLFGFEESYGYLVKPFVRDKDAVQAILLMAEMTAYYKKQGKTPYDGLQEIFQEYGYFKEKTISVKLPGQAGAAKIEQLMKGLRAEPLKEIAGVQIEATSDFADQTKTYADGKQEELEQAPSNVLKYELADGTWIAVRPSGTEPKIKFYIGVAAEDELAAQKALDQYEAAMKEFTA
ncbi:MULTISPECIES: phospho-sugar mutase [Aerococcus]|uniref:phosphoglucomutase (alpha-D-glucose-1,6-bisphosphate-dependent) n=1 Tax=Aerococcus sanguinicola TaxID=119206 RepID=A0A5N1GUK0_9LACT|nr:MULTISPECIES: phospho-sugar mutase [Aerococcus]KAA9302260.1 phospho-sugar mutase [Aerococcus sanguinicola]MDK6369014.1 phospho-sugar mutase [Aerococcus sp. UMB9870]MDK6678916.1 phospho-sugar mutase [Aerococcus sp. UMB8608]MDK6686765.1 phospho-sugar mutase [Aerococcus sp. UMB8623]MDK6939575.1 phospho-sugar mutase [Aerococcus sp. UMB8487]